MSTPPRVIDLDFGFEFVLSRGHLAAWTAGGGQLAIRDLRTDRHTLVTAHAKGINRISGCEAGLAITCAEGREALVWDLASATCTHTLKQGHKVKEARLSPDGTHALTVTDERRLWLWELATSEARSFPLPARQLINWSLSRDCRFAAGIATDGVRLFDLSTGRSRLLKGRVTRPRPAAFAPDGRHVAFTCEHGPGLAYVWSLTTKDTFELPIGNAVSTNLAFSPDGATLAASAYVVTPDQGLSVWDLASRQATRYPLAAMLVAFAHDGRWLFWASREQVGVIDTATGKTSTLGATCQGAPIALSPSPDGRSVAVAGVLPSQVVILENDLFVA